MAAKCPICSKPTLADYRPFCSKRCADVDLQRWLVGRYAIPAAREEDADDEEGGVSGSPPSGQGSGGRL
jgi:endogenous inhibitor of DNA gyrase (YacG/DUF329 family)